jgi:tRNA threonylcarbamoyladenosine biosynthesis protein TsaE
MQVKNSINYTLHNLHEAAQFVIEHAGNQKLWCFYGNMGAGKTTLIKEICKQLKINQQISSPTFSLVNEYTLPNHFPLYHFDFYRIKDITEVYDIGYETYFESGSICLIEWPEMIHEILVGETYIAIKIEVLESSRLIQIL